MLGVIERVGDGFQVTEFNRGIRHLLFDAGDSRCDQTIEDFRIGLFDVSQCERSCFRKRGDSGVA